MSKDILKRFKAGTVTRVLSMAMILNPGLLNQPESILSTNLGQKFMVEGRCSLQTNQSSLSFVFRDDPTQRRSIVVGISDGNTEIFSYYAGSAGGPARISDDLTGKQRDLEGLQIEIRGGSDYQVNIYPATNEIPREGNLKISHLRSETTAFASQSIRLPVCTLFPKT